MRKVICFAVSQSILARWRNHISQLFNVHGVIDVGQTEIQTAEPIVTEPSDFEFDLAIEKLKNHKSPGIDQILAELVKAGLRTIRYEFHKHITSVRNKEKVPEERKKSIILPMHKQALKQIVLLKETYHFCQLSTKFYPTSYSQG
jgi:hypothetical protein